MSQNQWNNPAINPMGVGQQGQIPFYSQNNAFLPRYKVIRVNGENGAEAFQMGPDSSVLLLDETAPILWVVQTDGAGYKTKTPFDLTPHQAATPVDLNQLEQRIAQLEEIVNAKYQSGNKSAKPRKQKSSEQPIDTAD